MSSQNLAHTRSVIYGGGVEKERCMGMMGACRGRQLHFLMFVLVEQKSIEGTSCFLSSAPSNRSNRICFLLLSTVIIMTIYWRQWLCPSTINSQYHQDRAQQNRLRMRQSGNLDHESLLPSTFSKWTLKTQTRDFPHEVTYHNIITYSDGLGSVHSWCVRSYYLNWPSLPCRPPLASCLTPSPSPATEAFRWPALPSPPPSLFTVKECWLFMRNLTARLAKEWTTYGTVQSNENLKDYEEKSQPRFAFAVVLKSRYIVIPKYKP